MFRPSAKKNQRWSSPAKIRLKVINILDWRPRKSSNNYLYFYGDLYRRFLYCFPVKKNRNLIYRTEVWLLLQFICLEIFYNEESSILSTIQPSGVVFRSLLERQSRKLFVHYEMGYNSKNIRAAVKTFYCKGRPKLSEGACQKSCVSNQNWGRYGQKEATYFKVVFLQVSPLK